MVWLLTALGANVLHWAGFTSSGIAAGSVAATVQSAFYGANVAAGSLFAAAQSAGALSVNNFATGIGAAVTAAAAAPLIAVAASDPQQGEFVHSGSADSERRQQALTASCPGGDSPAPSASQTSDPEPNEEDNAKSKPVTFPRSRL
mmetsp:Transcript_10697/g.25503  ORF Transcript_10697/g.25503 Transcript_10697/m.25503 type:complete len:146 (-) Transcript_10697:73-510(-)